MTDSVAAQATYTVDEVVANAERLGLTWPLRRATIVTPTTATSLRATAILDADTEAVPVTSMIGFVHAGLRVMTVNVPPGGIFIIGLATNEDSVATVRVTVAGQGFGSGVVSLIPFTTESYDTHNFWSSSSNTDIIVPFDGIYAVTLTTAWPVNSAGVRYCDVVLNSVIQAQHRHPAITGDNNELGLATEFECEAGDVIQFNGFQTSGIPLNITYAIATVRYVGSVS